MFLMSAVALAACPAEPDDLARALEEAEAAWRRLDTPALRTAHDEARQMAGCLDTRVPRDLVARLHRTEGIRAFADKQPDRAAEAFAAARRIDPSWQFPPSMVPEGHPLLALYVRHDVRTTETTSCDPPASGHLEFDGQYTRERPSNWPTLAMHLEDEGTVRRSAYLLPADPMFAYELPAPAPVVAPPEPIAVVADPTPTPSPKPASKARPKGPNTPLLVMTLVSGAAAGVSYALAATAREAYDDETDRGELAEARANTNRFVYLSAGLGVAAVGFGATAVIAGKW